MLKMQMVREEGKRRHFLLVRSLGSGSFYHCQAEYLGEGAKRLNYCTFRIYNENGADFEVELLR